MTKLIDASLVSGLGNVATSGNYNDLINTPEFGGGVQFPTEADAQAFASIPDTQYTVLVGNAEVGDFGTVAVYEPFPTPPILGYQDLNGIYWNLKANEILPEMAGARSASTSAATLNRIAFQKAADTGLNIKIPSKPYYYDGSVTTTFPGGGGVSGMGRGKSQIITQDTTSSNLFTVNGEGAVIFENVDYVATNLAKTSGAAIYLTSTTNANLNSRISGNTFAQFPTGINAVRALAYTISENVFSQYDIAVQIENQNHPDGGDSNITNNLFVVGLSGGNRIGILQYSSGGLKVIGNKINGGNIGYQMKARGSTSMPTQSTSILVMTGNSMEGQKFANIIMDRDPAADPSIRFYHAIITSNQINCFGSGVSSANISIGGNLNLKWGLISNNTIQLSETTGSTGIAIATLDQGSIMGNVIDASFGTGLVGVSLGSGFYGKLGPNVYGPAVAAGTPYSLTVPANVTLVGGG